MNIAMLKKSCAYTVVAKLAQTILVRFQACYQLQPHVIEARVVQLGVCDAICALTDPGVRASAKSRIGTARNGAVSHVLLFA